MERTEFQVLTAV